MTESQSKEMGKYFENIKEVISNAYKIAEKARKKGFDPEDKVDTHLAENMTDRVEGLISDVAPQLIGSGISKRMMELEKTYGTLDWRVSLVIAEEVAKGKFCKFDSTKEAIEIGVRVGFAYHTLGIVAAPLEGFIGVDEKKRRDGDPYLAIRFAGPIRGAGGTGASVCVLITDYVRKRLGYKPYDPDENEVERYVTELNDYNDRVANLQYHPSEDEIRLIAKNIPIELAGDPSEKLEVSNQKDLERVETNNIRGGLCLVFAMIALKSPKLWKRLSKWGEDFGMEWNFIKDFLDLQKKKKAGDEEKDTGKEKPKIVPNKTFVNELVAGRPVLTHPMAYGGFRLRYGRCRDSGFSCDAIHPVTMMLMDDFIAVGTQIKLERPGKAASFTACDSLEPPVVRLNNGNVVRVKDENEAKNIRKDVDKILFLGDLLINYGDFSENGHNLVKPGYCEEWWSQDFEKGIVDLFGTLDLEKASNLTGISSEEIKNFINQPIKNVPTMPQSLEISNKFQIPLHPYYTFYWKGVSKDELLNTLDKLENSKLESEGEIIKKIIINFDKELKQFLEKIGISHKVANEEFIVIESLYANPFWKSLGLDKISIKDAIEKISKSENQDIIDLVNELSEFPIKDKAGTFIGARMGRPEKAKIRKMVGKPHGLFPVGEEGDKMRSFQSALENGKVTADFALYYCKNCKKETIMSVCVDCGKKSIPLYYCDTCGTSEKAECEHGEKKRYKNMEININHYFNKCLGMLKTSVYPDLIKGVKGTTNKDKIPEHLIKSILRAKHEIEVNKDGTVRYDMSELPLTHFKPNDINTSIDKLKEMGYEKDINGNELEQRDQTLEIKPQDVVLPSLKTGVDEACDEILYRVGNFVDELLVKLYGMKPYYNFKSKEDVIGKYVIGLAPHISAGMTGRIIGFANTTGCFAHPLWHAALRRDCDGDEASVSLLLDSLLNFSRKYLPDRIGSRTMDAPLVLTKKLEPGEVDDMAHGMDVVWKYPLEFYKAAEKYSDIGDVEIELLGDRLGTWKQYEGMGFTHDTSSIASGVLCSAYKIYPSMKEKLDGQMSLAEKINAVKEDDVARLIIDTHFMKDIKGNLRKFSMQQFRCVKCNEKFRRPPLKGKCTFCGGKILFTISEGSVIKYLQPALDLANKYNLGEYLKETIDLTKRRIDGVFGKEKEKQSGLGNWF